MEEGQSFQQKAGAVVYPQFNHIYIHIYIYYIKFKVNKFNLIIYI